MPFMTTEELQQQRRAYIESIARLKRKWNTMTFEAKFRAGKTMANIQRQIDAIDAELKMAGAA